MNVTQNTTAQYSEEELLQYIKQQCEENEEFRKKVIEAVKEKRKKTIKNMVLKWLKTTGRQVQQPMIEVLISKIFSWVSEFFINQ
jgi:hypothetical protein